MKQTVKTKQNPKYMKQNQPEKHHQNKQNGIKLMIARKFALEQKRKGGLFHFSYIGVDIQARDAYHY